MAISEEGSLIFKLNHDLENHTPKSENPINRTTSLNQANSAYGKFFQSSSNSNKKSKTQVETEKKKELAEIAHSTQNDQRFHSKTIKRSAATRLLNCSNINPPLASDFAVVFEVTLH